VILSDLLLALKQLDEITLVEILELHSEEIVDKFQSEIEERYEDLRYKVEDPREDEEKGYEPLTGKLSWKTPDPQALDYDYFNERSEGDD
jgi:hypothetical protein